MGGYATLHFGLTYPDRALSLVVAGAGYGSGDREKFKQDSAVVVKRFAQGMEAVTEFYAKGPTRVQFMDKDPVGWAEFRAQLAAGSALGHSLTMQGVQMKRPSVFELGDRMERLDVPTLIMTGDEDDPLPRTRHLHEAQDPHGWPRGSAEVGARHQLGGAGCLQSGRPRLRDGRRRRPLDAPQSGVDDGLGHFAG